MMASNTLKPAHLTCDCVVKFGREIVGPEYQAVYWPPVGSTSWSAQTKCEFCHGTGTIKPTPLRVGDRIRVNERCLGYLRATGVIEELTRADTCAMVRLDDGRHRELVVGSLDRFNSKEIGVAPAIEDVLADRIHQMNPTPARIVVGDTVRVDDRFDLTDITKTGPSHIDELMTSVDTLLVAFAKSQRRNNDSRALFDAIDKARTAIRAVGEIVGPAGRSKPPLTGIVEGGPLGLESDNDYGWEW